MQEEQEVELESHGLIKAKKLSPLKGEQYLRENPQVRISKVAGVGRKDPLSLAGATFSGGCVMDTRSCSATWSSDGEWQAIGAPMAYWSLW